MGEGNIGCSGVHQGMLETVVPKTQKAAVMIVRGKKHKWQVHTVPSLLSSVQFFFDHYCTYI